MLNFEAIYNVTAEAGYSQHFTAEKDAGIASHVMNIFITYFG